MTRKEINKMIEELQEEYTSGLVKQGWDRDQAKKEAEKLEISLPFPGGTTTTNIDVSLRKVIVDNRGHTKTVIQIYPC